MSNQRRVAVIATKGNLDEAYPPLNIAIAAAALGAETAIFFTFTGLNILHKQGNQNLPVAEDKKGIKDALQANNIPPIHELLAIAQESGVKLIACQMTMDVMNIQQEDLIDGVEVGGATMFLDYAFDADVTTTF